MTRTKKKTHKNYGEKGGEGVLGDFIYDQNKRKKKDRVIKIQSIDDK